MTSQPPPSRIYFCVHIKLSVIQYYYPNSTEAMAQIESFENPVLDMFATPQFDDSIAYSEEYEIYEQHGSKIDRDVKTLSFQVADKNAFYDLSESRVQLRFKIVKKADESAFTAYSPAGADPVAVPAIRADEVLLAASSSALFKGAKLTIDGVDIETVAHAHIRGLLLDLLEYRDADKASADQQWIYPEKRVYDFDNNVDTTGQVGTVAAVSTNPSALARLARHDSNVSGVEVELWIPLRKFFGFVRNNRAALITQSMQINFEIAADGMGIIKRRGGTAVAYVAGNPVAIPPVPTIPAAMGTWLDDGTARITWCSLWLRKVVPTDKYKAEIITTLGNRSQYKRMWIQHDTYKLDPVPDSAGSNRQFRIAHKYAKLGRIYVVAMAYPKTIGSGRLQGFVLGENANMGHQAQFYNPGMFDCVKWTSAHVQVNGTTIPAKPYKMDFDKGQYQRVYEAWLDAVRNHNRNSKLNIPCDFETFKSSYPVLTFDVNSPGQAMYEQTSQSEIYVSVDMADSPVMSAYGDAAQGTDKEYVLYAVVESYRSVVLETGEGFMKVASVSAM